MGRKFVGGEWQIVLASVSMRFGDRLKTDRNVKPSQPVPQRFDGAYIGNSYSSIAVPVIGLFF